FALGALAFVGCTSEEIVNEGAQSNAIGFEGTIMKQSRADAISGDLTLANLDKFMVYGFYTRENQEANPIQVFSGDAVLKSAGTWGYSGTRYWVPKATYSFFAYSCADIALDNNYGSVGLDLNATGGDRQLLISNFRCDRFHQHDLIYAQQKGIYAEPKTDTNPRPNADVSFTFEHILTKIDAVFTSEFDADYDVVIKDVKISNFRNVGSFSKTKGWGLTPDRDFKLESSISMQMEFDTADGAGVANGSQKTEEKPKTKSYYVLPYSYERTDVQISFTIELYKGTAHTPENMILSRNMEGHWAPKWELGYYYTYNVSLTGTAADLQPIVFEVAQSMNDWKVGSSTATDISFSAN
ncbi:MAG: fimbrillin family protein, partial [Bacteroidaceae bacterium]|nr:fimbrillin family protein [Bacteroidaceae bacterium]